MFRLEPGCASAWSHNKVGEESFFVLRGRGEVWLGNKAHVVRPGSFVLIPPSVVRSIRASKGEALEYYATLHDLTTDDRAAQVDHALRAVSLHLHASRRVSHLSPGLLQRLALAQALVGSPRALLLDETLCGQGLLFDKDIVALLTQLSRAGVTTILTAQHAVELHRVVNRIVRLSEGRILTPRHERAMEAELMYS